MDRIPYHLALPDRFFSIAAKPYASLPFQPDENPSIIHVLFAQEAANNEIIFYTDYQSIRLAGIFPHHSTEAYFGFWETENDTALNQEAFAQLESDARQRGRIVITGPLNFSTFHRYRLRLNEIPSWGMFDREPVNPVYYPGLLEKLGYTPKAFFESRLIRKETVPAVYQNKKLLLEQINKIPFDFIPLNPDNWQQYEDEIFILVHEVFSANPAYKPIPKSQFQLLYNHSFAQKLCPHSSVLFRDKASGRLAAMSFCHPNYQSLRLPADISPIFSRDFAQLDKKVLLAKSVGVHPDFRNQGLMSYLGVYAMRGFQELYEEVIFCLMRSDNYSRHFSNDLPFESAHYALYEKLMQLNG